MIAGALTQGTSNATPTPTPTPCNASAFIIRRVLGLGDVHLQLTSEEDTTIQQTELRDTSGNDTDETIVINAVDVWAPFAFQQSGQLPITIAAGAELSLPFTFTPTATGEFESVITLLAPSSSPMPSSEETVWVEDRFPTGCTFVGDGNNWNWIGAGPSARFSGNAAHYSSVVRGQHEHSFQGATATLALGTGDKLFTYVILIQSVRPRRSCSSGRRHLGTSRLLGYQPDQPGNEQYCEPVPCWWAAAARSAGQAGDLGCRSWTWESYANIPSRGDQS